MKIAPEIQADGRAGKFVATRDDGAPAGEIEYDVRDGAMHATHTWVDPELRGHGVAGKLLHALVEKARADKMKIVPVCSFVVGAFEKHPEEFADVMAPGK